MKYKVGDWVKVIKQDWTDIELGTVLQIVYISINPAYAYTYYHLAFANNTYPYSEDEITVATKLDKALS